jgi:Ca2+-binding RTX toxin-like protein
MAAATRWPGGTGVDLAHGQDGDDTITGGTGADTVFGGQGSDSLAVAGGGNPYLDGDEGDDSLIAASSDATLLGGAGNDTLDGGTGADPPTGGLGNDAFRFAAGQAQGDTANDFNGNGPLAGDRIVSVGYGTVAQGASFADMGGGTWQVTSVNGLVVETITFLSAPAIHISDYAFT